MKFSSTFFTRLTTLIIILPAYASVSAQVDLQMSVWRSEATNGCLETMTFLSDKEYLMESGDQMLTKAYKLNQYRNTDYFVFFQRTTANNGISSCYGIKGRDVGTRIKTYARFNEAKTIMTLYSKPEEGIDLVFYKQGSPGASSSAVAQNDETEVIETADARISNSESIKPKSNDQAIK